LAQDGKAAGDSPLNVRPHAKVSVNKNTKVTHRLGWNDVMRPNPECRSWQLVLTASSSTPKQLRLVGIQLETVGRHPAVYIVYARRQTLLNSSTLIAELAGGRPRPAAD